jgi:AraC-like DNA-binding protein
MLQSTGPAVRLSTDAIAPQDRFAVWSEVIGRSLLNVEIEQACAGEFRAHATLRTLPGLRILSAASSPVIYRRTAPLIRGDDVLFSFGAAEGCHAQQRDRDAVLQPGDALLMLGSERAVVERRTAGRMNCLRVPYAALATHVRRVEDAFCRRIPGETPTLRLLARYLDLLDNDEVLARPELRESAVTHVLDLVALVVGATGDAAALAAGRGLRAARLKAVKDDIARRLGEESLSVATIAARHKITVRAVQRLFEQSGATFTEYLVAQRLERARRLISDPRNPTVTAIAYEVGFSDLSYFNRAFRRRFGATPSELRAAALTTH